MVPRGGWRHDQGRGAVAGRTLEKQLPRPGQALTRACTLQVTRPPKVEGESDPAAGVVLSMDRDPHVRVEWIVHHDTPAHVAMLEEYKEKQRRKGPKGRRGRREGRRTG